MSTTTNSDATSRLKVFISYSRQDREFADELLAALETCGFAAYLDRQDIAPGEAWEARLTSLIREADTIVYVVSPASIRSTHCSWEVAETQRMAKRIIPVVSAPVADDAVPPSLKRLNYIYFDKPHSFGIGLAQLVEALNTDLGWLRDHTHLLEEAMRWELHGRAEALLLRGTALDEARAWQSRRPRHAPEPTALQLEFISQSIDAEERRNNRERQQIAEMALANDGREKALRKAEETLKEMADVLRRRARARAVAMVVITGLAAAAGLFGWQASAKQKIIAATLARATNIIAEVQGHLGESAQRQVFGLFEEGAARGDVLAMTNLAISYMRGIGTGADAAKAREWFTRAAEAGGPAAMAHLGKLMETGTGGPKDIAGAFKLYERSANLNNTTGMVYLANMYRTGSAGREDDATARQWLEKAADRDEPEAFHGLARLYAKLGSKLYDPVMALDFERKAAERVEARERKAAGQLGSDTMNALTGLAWFAIMAKDYSSSLAAAERALAIAPDSLGAKANRAHALMLLGRTDEAKEIYLANRGKAMAPPVDPTSWDRAISEDFATLRQLGIEQALMLEVSAALKP